MKSIALVSRNLGQSISMTICMQTLSSTFPCTAPHIFQCKSRYSGGGMYLIILWLDDKKTSRYIFFMKTFEPHESQVCEMYSIFEIHLQNNLSDDQVGICFPQFDHTHAMLASSWLSVHYSWLIPNFPSNSGFNYIHGT